MPRTSCHVLIKGYVGRSAELRYTPNGVPVSNFTIAINPTKEGPPTWFRVAAWGEKAELVNEIEKGMYVAVRGTLKQRDWTDNDGNVHTQLEVNYTDHQIPEIGAEAETEGESEAPAAPPTPPAKPAPKPAARPATVKQAPVPAAPARTAAKPVSKPAAKPAEDSGEELPF